MSSVDPFELAVSTVVSANDEGISLKLIGGQAIRYLTPAFPARSRVGQDMDFASVSEHKGRVIEFLQASGFQGDERFNALYGHKQMYFRTPDGSTSVDVVMDQLDMCHTLDFADRIDRLPVTLGVADLLLSKLQVVQQNDKDVVDIVYILSAFPVEDGDEAESVGLDRVASVVRDDWGWWKTVTSNLEKVVDIVQRDLRHFVPASAVHDPIAQALSLRQFAESVPKSLRWKLRSKVGERVQWYQLPEEAGH